MVSSFETHVPAVSRGRGGQPRRLSPPQRPTDGSGSPALGASTLPQRHHPRSSRTPPPSVCFQEDRASKPSTGSSCFLNVTPQGRQVSCPQVPKDSREAEEECWSSKNRKKLPAAQVDTQNALGPTLRPQAQAALGTYVCSLHAAHPPPPPPRGRPRHMPVLRRCASQHRARLGTHKGTAHAPSGQEAMVGSVAGTLTWAPGSRPSPRGWWELRLATDLWRGAKVMDVPPRSCCMGPCRWQRLPCWLDGAGRPRPAPRSWEARQ